MDKTGTEAVIEELGNLINQLRGQIMSYRQAEYEQRIDLKKAEAKIVELGGKGLDDNGSAPWKATDEELNKWNK